MTDEPRKAEEGIQAEAGTPGTTEEKAEGQTDGAAEGTEAEEGKPKLKQSVEIQDIGPCKKHVKVAVQRESIDGRLAEKFKELVQGESTVVPGFRPGKAPRKLVERRFKSEVSDQVKAELMLASLEQLAEDHDLAPLAPPSLDPLAIELPDQGDFVYEFDVEVRPQFDLPSYKGLKLKRPTKEFSPDEVAREERRILMPHAQVVPKEGSAAAEGDIVVVDVTVRDGDRVVNTMKETAIRVEPKLAFKDGVAERFGEQIQGATAGQSRVVDITLSQASADPSLRGKTVHATCDVKDVKTLRMPELTHEFLHNFGVHSEEQFRELVHALLKRRLERTQRQAAREQVVQQLVGTAAWDLPEDLLARQARRALSRRVMEMRSEGVAESEIEANLRLMQQDVLRTTALSLKEHFLLQKIAEAEKIDVDEQDIEDEIERLAEIYDESPRRLRARLEKEDMVEALAAEIVEREVLDLICENAEWEDVPLGRVDQANVETVEAQTVPGEMQDPTATVEAGPEDKPEAQG